MDDEQGAGSGSRWESGADRTANEAAEPATPESGPTATETDGGRRVWMRSRGVVTGAGVGLAAVIGLGGFALGHTTAGDDDGGRPGPGFHRFDGDQDGDGRGPGPHRGDPGQLPGALPQRPDAASPRSPSTGDDSPSSDDDNSS